MAESAGEKTEAPTSRRRAEARQEGNIAKSMDLTAASMMLSAFLLIFFFSERVFFTLRYTMEAMLRGDYTVNPTRFDDVDKLVGVMAHAVGGTVGPIAGVLLVIGAVSVLGQVGFLLTGKPLIPKFSKLNPYSGLKNILGARGFMRLTQSMAKLVLISAVAGWIVMRDMDKVLGLATMDPQVMIAVAAWLIFELAVILAIVVFVLALTDLWYQRYQHEKDLRMTKEDVKREMKDMEGDPLLKQRRARVARQLAMQRISSAVPKADVIVTNPTHFAVALKYDSTMRAPKVVAKGADFMAMRIRQLGAVHGIPMIERKPLARALYHGVEVGQEVPQEHYAAVAEILAYVYRLSGRKAA